METERQIVYSLLNTLRNHSYNIDEDISERLLRSHILTYRADSIRKHYKNGHTVSDEVFQSVELTMERSLGTLFKASTPRVINLDKNYGMRLEKLGHHIPILTSGSFEMAHYSPFAPKVFAAQKGSSVELYFGSFDKSPAAKEIYKAIEKAKNSGSDKERISVDFYAILYNPSDDPDYNWETDIFPFPAERNSELKNQILKNEFGIIVDLRAKKDEVLNQRPDNIRYHEESRISE